MTEKWLFCCSTRIVKILPICNSSNTWIAPGALFVTEKLGCIVIYVYTYYHVCCLDFLPKLCYRKRLSPSFLLNVLKLKNKDNKITNAYKQKYLINNIKWYNIKEGDVLHNTTLTTQVHLFIKFMAIINCFLRLLGTIQILIPPKTIKLVPRIIGNITWNTIILTTTIMVAHRRLPN